MKLMLLIQLFLNSLAFAGHEDNTLVTYCRVTRMVDYTYFEEGLSAHEYPGVEVRKSKLGQYSVSFGVHRPFDLESGDKIQLFTDQPVKSSLHIMRKHGDEVLLEIEWRKVMAKFKIKVKSEDTGKAKTLAYGLCEKGIL